MTNNYLADKYNSRINTLLGRGDKNIKQPGVIRKLRRKLMKMEK